MFSTFQYFQQRHTLKTPDSLQEIMSMPCSFPSSRFQAASFCIFSLYSIQNITWLLCPEAKKAKSTWELPPPPSSQVLPPSLTLPILYLPAHPCSFNLIPQIPPTSTLFYSISQNFPMGSITYSFFDSLSFFTSHFLTFLDFIQLCNQLYALVFLCQGLFGGKPSHGTL